MGNPVRAVVLVRSPWIALLDEFDKLPKDQLKRYAELGITGDSWQFGELNNTMRAMWNTERNNNSQALLQEHCAQQKRLTLITRSTSQERFIRPLTLHPRRNTFVGTQNAFAQDSPGLDD